MKKKLIIIGGIIAVVLLGAGIYVRYIMDWGNAEDNSVQNEVVEGEKVKTAAGVEVNEIPKDLNGTFKTEPTDVEAPTSKLMFEITGPQNATGRFNNFSAEYVQLNDGNGSISLTVDVASIYTANSMRDGHLKESDWFNTSEFPSITFESSQINLGEKGYEAMGKLSFMGKEYDYQFPFQYLGRNTREDGEEFVAFEGKFDFDRTQFGMVSADGVGDVAAVEFRVELVKE